MRWALFLIVTIWFVGCGKKTTSAQPRTKSESSKPKVETEIPVNAFVNTLGMPFVPVPGTKVQFCIWETRVKDYATYAAANAGVNGKWKQTPAYFKEKGIKQTDTHPVVEVSWEDAGAFCEWLTKKEMAEGKIKAGQKYRLPTDAEWSVAVGLGQEKGNTPKEKKAGIKGVYPWGKEWPPPKGAGNYYNSLKVDNFEYTAPVGNFAANKFGLHDMGGNVWEWCEDWSDPVEKTYRVRRGASWSDDLRNPLLSTRRDGTTPYGTGSAYGFRCVLEGE